MEGVRSILIFEHQQSRPEKIFWAALFLSALLHLVVILNLKLPEFPEPMRAKQALSVILAKSQEAKQTVPKALPPMVTPITSPPVTVLPQELPSPPPDAPVKEEELPPPMEVQEPMSEPEPEIDLEEITQELPADPVNPGPEVISARKVKALLLIDENGHAHQIIWDALPALTNETLHQIEQGLRAKTYLATGKTYTLYEIVEIPRE